MVPRRTRAASHASRRHRLRGGGGQDDLWNDRLQGLGLPRRGPPCQGGSARSGEPLKGATRLSWKERRCFSPLEPSTGKCKKAACRGRRIAATRSATASLGG